MLRILTYKELTADQKSALLLRAAAEDQEALRIATAIIDDVKARGIAAVLETTERIDGIRTELTVGAAEWAAADRLSAAEKAAFSSAAANIRAFHLLQKNQLRAAEEEIAGARLGFRYQPVDAAALYVPGGKARYPSTVLMGLIPAAVAGVPSMTVVTPPAPDGSVDPSVLFCAQLLGCSQVIKHGGAQGLAAAALGLAFAPTPLIIGPGNRYVTAAKQVLAGRGLIRQDQPAGPSEVIVIADDSANPEFIAADLLSQAEHGPDSPTFLLTTSESLARAVQAAVARGLQERPERGEWKATSIREHSYAILFDTMEDAIAFSNDYGPEHLEICTRDPERDFALIRSAGSVFLGHYAPVALGDYYSGTNHILPTGGAARSTSGVGVDTFLKRITYQYPSRESLQQALDPVLIMSRLEGLEHEHGHSVAIRLKNPGPNP